ncbi:hypothetical protein V7147_15300 [Bacillus sp. JJ1521]|uniref:hypothetical protein n=1 Tax=Bacillus sp. JJ1521 TaxID=3122957 RepID=UPI00300002AA
MSLFQICYGPEIGAIFHSIQKYPGIHKSDLIKNYQYQPEGDISSLVDAALNFLLNLRYIEIDKKKGIWPLINNYQVRELTIVKRLNEIADVNQDPTGPNYIFSTMYYQMFVIPNRMYIKDLYYEANLTYEKLAISQEKVNAWKRIMEHLRLGYRVYGGFYALPHTNLIEDIIEEIGEWDGPLQLFFEKKIHPVIPCISNGTIFNGILYGILHLGKTGVATLTKKQDLPYLSYGEKGQWNWITVGGNQE